MELAAQAEYQRELDALESELADVRARLRELQQQQGDQQVLVASPEVMEAIEKVQLQEAELRSERREIRRKLREDIELLELNLALFNLLTMPILVSLFGVQFFLSRNKRRKSVNPSSKA